MIALSEDDGLSLLKSRIGGLDSGDADFDEDDENETHDVLVGIVASIATNTSGRRDQLEPVAELDGAGNVVSRFVYGTKPHSPDYMVRDGRTYRIVSDHLGSPRMVIDVDTGAVVQEMRYDEWGVVTLDTNPGWQPFGFAGGLWDSDTGLTRFGARDYSAAEARWTAKDAAGLGAAAGMMFVYAYNDPVNFVDVTGANANPATSDAPRFIPFVVPPPPPPAMLPWLGPAGLIGGALLCGTGVICDPPDLTIPEGGAEPTSCPAPQSTPAPKPKHKCPDPVAEATCKALAEKTNWAAWGPNPAMDYKAVAIANCEAYYKYCTKTPPIVGE